MLGSNPLFHQQPSLQLQEQRPGWLLGSEQTTADIMPPKYFSSYIGSTRQRAVVSEGQQSWAQQQEPGLELCCAELLPARAEGLLQDWQRVLCQGRKEPGFCSPQYFKVLTGEFKRVSGLSQSFFIWFCHVSLTWAAHMQGSEEIYGDTVLASVDFTPAWSESIKTGMFSWVDEKQEFFSLASMVSTEQGPKVLVKCFYIWGQFHVKHL